MLKKNILSSNIFYLSIFHKKKDINRYLDILNDIFYTIGRCDRGNEDIYKKLESSVAKKPFERLN